MVPSILLVDDNKSVREFCRQELTAEGYVVMVARDGNHALAVLSQIIPDLVVMDVQMPCCGGQQAARRIKAKFPALPVIFYTALHDGGKNGGNSSLGDAWVEKSADLGPLKAAIVKSLTSRPLSEPNYLPTAMCEASL